jgi:hypothetical protein
MFYVYVTPHEWCVNSVENEVYVVGVQAGCRSVIKEPPFMQAERSEVGCMEGPPAIESPCMFCIVSSVSIALLIRQGWLRRVAIPWLR